MTNRAQLDDLKGKALETAYRLDAYSFYGGTEAGAIRALQRRCAGTDKQELADWLRRAIDVQSHASAWLRDNASRVRESSDTLTEIDFRRIARDFYDAHPEWPPKELDGLLGINYFYFYLK